MKIRVGLLGLVIVTAVLVALWDVGRRPPPPVAPIEQAGVTVTPKEIKLSNQPRSVESVPVLPTPDKPMIEPEWVAPPVLPDRLEVARDTGPFIDAEPSKLSAPPLGPEPPPRDTGPFIDAGGPPSSHSGALGTVQAGKRIPISPPKPGQ
jgi:hypothetical protein